MIHSRTNSTDIALYTRLSDADRKAALALDHIKEREAQEAKRREQFEKECG